MEKRAASFQFHLSTLLLVALTVSAVVWINIRDENSIGWPHVFLKHVNWGLKLSHWDFMPETFLIDAIFAAAILFDVNVYIQFVLNGGDFTASTPRSRLIGLLGGIAILFVVGPFLALRFVKEDSLWSGAFCLSALMVAIAIVIARATRRTGPQVYRLFSD
ncbi:MAG TPA: hypothetical protein VEK08_12650 [Planctomycetota bacterium]|nr:hypothetical protein [Planctomycetota bacterium]